MLPPSKKQRIVVDANDSSFNVASNNTSNSKNEKEPKQTKCNWSKISGVATSLQEIFRWISPKFLWGSIILVCKDWNKFIKSDLFIQGYFNLHFFTKLTNNLPLDENWVKQCLSAQSIVRELKRRQINKNKSFTDDLALYEIVMEEANELSLNEAKKKIRFRNRTNPKTPIFTSKQSKRATNEKRIQTYQIGMKTSKQYQPKIDALFSITKNSGKNSSNNNHKNTRNEKKSAQRPNSLSNHKDSNYTSKLLELKQEYDRTVRNRKRALFALMYIRHITIESMEQVVCQNCLEKCNHLNQIPTDGMIGDVNENGFINICDSCAKLVDFDVIRMTDAIKIYGVSIDDLKEILHVKPFKNKFLESELDLTYRVFANVSGLIYKTKLDKYEKEFKSTYGTLYIQKEIVKFVHQIKYYNNYQSDKTFRYRIDEARIVRIEDAISRTSKNLTKEEFEHQFVKAMEQIHTERIKLSSPTRASTSLTPKQIDAVIKDFCERNEHVFTVVSRHRAE